MVGKIWPGKGPKGSPVKMFGRDAWAPKRLGSPALPFASVFSGFAVGILK